MSELTFDDYKKRISIQEVLQDAGYHFYRRDGLRYPSYVRLDNEGRRIRGDKYIVCANGMACFQPPQQRRYNIINFIAEHPELFPEGKVGKDPYVVVNEVCHRLLNMPMETRQQRIVEPLKDTRPFNLGDYKTEKWEADKWETQTKFFPFFKHRGISLQTQRAFANSFLLTTYGTHQNLSFPMVIPGKDDGNIIGFEERGRAKSDGTSYKGMARGSNARQGMWIASPYGTKLQDAKRVFLFESAYDAMAFYQLLMGSNNLTYKEKKELKSGVYASTGGNPSAGQLEGLMRTAKEATFHLGFDMDDAGKTFAEQFKALGRREQIPEERIIREECSPGYKDFNEELLANIEKRSNPLNPGNVSEDLKAYVDTFRKNPDDIPAVKEVLNPSNNQVYLLPEPLYKLYSRYESLYEEAYIMKHSRLVAPEDKEDAKEKALTAGKEFREALADALGVKDEEVELCDEEKKDHAGVDMDADGNVELDECDETKHYRTRR